MIRTLAIVLLLTASAPAMAALDDDTIRARTREVLQDPEYQTQRPDGQAAPDRERPQQRMREPGSGGSGSDPLAARAPSEISQALVWIVLIGLLAFVVVLLAAQARRGLKRRSLSSPTRTIAAPEHIVELDAEKLDETLRAALELARAGRFEEAVHLLLTGAIRELQSSVGLATEAALTSRELLAAARLRPEPLDAFRDLVFSVEVSLFGGLTVSNEDFERCATSFRTLRKVAAT